MDFPRGRAKKAKVKITKNVEGAFTSPSTSGGGERRARSRSRDAASAAKRGASPGSAVTATRRARSASPSPARRRHAARFSLRAAPLDDGARCLVRVRHVSATSVRGVRQCGAEVVLALPVACQHSSKLAARMFPAGRLLAACVADVADLQALRTDNDADAEHQDNEKSK